MTVRTSPCRLDGLVNGRKPHVRVVAANETVVYEYAVAAESGDGTGTPGAPVPADPHGWRHWHPPIPLAFRRHHSYHGPPYLPGPRTPAHYDGQETPSDLPAIADLL